MVDVGDPAPDFTATASDGRTVSLADFQGKQPVVLFFYPADYSPICTQEACSFRDAYEDFAKLGAAVIGVSGDSDETHRAFAGAHHLPYLMISDAAGTLRRLYGVTNYLLVLPSRITFVIDRQGIVRLKFDSQLFGSKHVEQAIKILRSLQSQSTS